MTATHTQVEAGEAIEMSLMPSSDGRQVGTAPGTPNDEPAADRGMDRATTLKIMSAGFSFFVAGVNDGSIGALLPYVLREYNIDTAIVSSVYGATFLGWFLAAVVNAHLCQYLDLGAMLVLGAALQVTAQVLRSWLPPFGLFVTSFWVVSLGQAFQDTHANTFVAGAKVAHRWLAFIHAMYMAGCLIGPFVSTAVASAGEVSRWYLFYTFPLALGVVNTAMCAYAFRDTVALKRKRTVPSAEDQSHVDGDETIDASRNKGAIRLIKATFSTPSVWLLSMFFFFYLGAVLTASGWVVEYLVNVRDGKLSLMGYVPAGFNGGALLGRILLAEPTHRFGARRMIFLYCVMALALQLVFWLVPNIIAASIAVSFVGFFTGPLFATGIGLGSKLFPEHIHATALAMVFVFAQMGGSVFPIITGVIAAAAGVAVLQPILVGLLVATAISWLLVPKPKSMSNAALHQE